MHLPLNLHNIFIVFNWFKYKRKAKKMYNNNNNNSNNNNNNNNNNNDDNNNNMHASVKVKLCIHIYIFWVVLQEMKTNWNKKMCMKINYLQHIHCPLHSAQLIPQTFSLLPIFLKQNFWYSIFVCGWCKWWVGLLHVRSNLYVIVNDCVIAFFLYKYIRFWINNLCKRKINILYFTPKNHWDTVLLIYRSMKDVDSWNNLSMIALIVLFWQILPRYIVLNN